MYLNYYYYGDRYPVPSENDDSTNYRVIVDGYVEYRSTVNYVSRLTARLRYPFAVEYVSLIFVNDYPVSGSPISVYVDITNDILPVDYVKHRK